jgi:hypothetical protein
MFIQTATGRVLLHYMYGSLDVGVFCVCSFWGFVCVCVYACASDITTSLSSCVVMWLDVYVPQTHTHTPPHHTTRHPP